MLHSDDLPEEYCPLTREDPSAFSPPPAFGPFRVLHQIGIGTLGPVFRTYEPTRDRLVAVKVFRLDIIPEQAHTLADALSRAARASLFHPSIVEPIASGVEGTVAYRAEEYVAAESLDVAMRHYAPATIDKALPFITQLAGALDFARAAGIGHGGLHPRDVFVTPDEARATGFGVVEALEQVGIRAPIRRPYTAPERIAGGAWSTPADVFSLAAIAFELLTARRPAGTGAQIGSLPDGERSSALHDVLARGMDEAPSRRYPTALAFAAALELAARGSQSASPASSASIPASASPAPAPISISPIAASAAPAPSSTQAPRPASTTPSSVVPVPPVPASPATTPMPAVQAPSVSAFSSPPSVVPVPPAAASPPPTPVPAVPASPVSASSSAPSPVVTPRAPASAVPPPAIARPATPASSSPRTPGEFEIEDELNPVHAALDDLVAKREAGAAIPTLFDDVEEDDLVGDASADTGTVAKFADDFVESPVDAGTLAAVHGTRARATISPVDEPESPSRTAGGHEMFDSSEPPRQTLLPIAVALVLGLLIGFAGGYFVRSNERLAPTPVESSIGAERRPAAAALPAGAATSDKPGQYSEQKVTPPVATPPAPRTAPPVPNETARATPRTPPVPTRGTLVVKSSPSHAQVTLNGKWRGRTPLTIDDLAFGKYNVRVVQPGYRVAQQDFALTARDDDHAFTARLEPDERVIAPQRGRPPVVGGTEAAAPATYTGSLFVDSRPRGATVLVDGKSIGQTPVMVSNVAVGAHVVRIELTGKKPWTASTRVASGETARVTGSLEDKP